MSATTRSEVMVVAIPMTSCGGKADHPEVTGSPSPLQPATTTLLYTWAVLHPLLNSR